MRSKTEVDRVEVLFPPETGAGVRAAAERAGMGVGTWVATCAAKLSGVEYTPPPKGRPKKETAPEPKKTRRKRKA